MERISYTELKNLNLPWIGKIPVGESAYKIVITEIKSEGEGVFSFRGNGGWFEQNLNGNSLPEIGDIVFTFGSEYYKRGFATQTSLFDFKTESQDRAELKKWSEKIREQSKKLIEEEEKMRNAEFTILNQSLWDECVENNTDPYGRAVVLYAERWATNMEKRLSPNSSREEFAEIANEESRKADVNGITGFMYGAAVNILSQVWKYGTELKTWHNKLYGDANAKGVINPAVMVVS